MASCQPSPSTCRPAGGRLPAKIGWQEGGLEKKKMEEKWKGAMRESKTNTAWSRPEIRAVRARAVPAFARKPNETARAKKIFCRNISAFLRQSSANAKKPSRSFKSENSRTVPESFIERCIAFIRPLMKRSI